MKTTKELTAKTASNNIPADSGVKTHVYAPQPSVYCGQKPGDVSSTYATEANLRETGTTTHLAATTAICNATARKASIEYKKSKTFIRSKARGTTTSKNNQTSGKNSHRK